MKYRVLHVLLLLPLLLSCIGEGVENQSLLGPGDMVPGFELAMEDGTRVTSAALSAGCFVLVFFNTSCSDCRKTLPQVQLAMEKWPQVRFIAVSREQDAASVRSYWDKEGLSIPFAPCEDRKVYSLFASSGIPRVYVCSRGGRIEAAWDDAPCPTFDDIDEALARIAL